jgi:CheY-like chemotaxis protein
MTLVSGIIRSTITLHAIFLLTVTFVEKNGETANIPFIFLTAKIDKTDLRKAMQMGADDYITKPFEDIELLNAIEIRPNKHEKINSVLAGWHLRWLIC